MGLFFSFSLSLNRLGDLERISTLKIMPCFWTNSQKFAHEILSLKVPNVEFDFDVSE